MTVSFGIYPFTEEQKQHILSLRTKEEVDEIDWKGGLSDKTEHTIRVSTINDGLRATQKTQF